MKCTPETHSLVVSRGAQQPGDVAGSPLDVVGDGHAVEELPEACQPLLLRARPANGVLVGVRALGRHRRRELGGHGLHERHLGDGLRDRHLGHGAHERRLRHGRARASARARQPREGERVDRRQRAGGGRRRARLAPQLALQGRRHRRRRSARRLARERARERLLRLPPLHAFVHRVCLQSKRDALHSALRAHTHTHTHTRLHTLTRARALASTSNRSPGPVYPT